MGQRANLVIVTSEGYELFYTHWRASTLDRDLFWGPAHALKFIRSQRSSDDGAEWLDEVWAEGGALMDVRTSHLLWWGGEDLAFDVPMRRVFLELMAHPWKGWEIDWAHEGIVDLAEYVGKPRSEVLAERPSSDLGPSLAPLEEPGWIDGVLSVTMGDGRVTLFPLAGNVDDLLINCDELERAVACSTGVPDLELQSFPQSGAHVDLRSKAASFWTSMASPNVEQRLRTANPHWNICWWYDEFESQQRQCGSRLKFPTVDLVNLVEQVHQRIRMSDKDMSDYMLDMAKGLYPEQEKVEINPFSLRDDPLPVSDEVKAHIWEEALRAWQSNQA